MNNQTEFGFYSISLWKQEFLCIFENQRAIEIRKLGSYGSYIENIITYSEDKNLSLNCFKEAFVDLIKFEINGEKISIEKADFIISVINTFKFNIEFNTSYSDFYLTSSTKIVYRILVSEVDYLLFEGIVFNYFIYLNFLNINSKLRLKHNIDLKKSILSVAHKALGINDRISSISIFIISNIDEEFTISLDDFGEDVLQNVFRYCILNKELDNQNVNNFIIDFGIKYKQKFIDEIARFECKLNNDCNALIYRDGLIQRDLVPNYIKWEKLKDIYYENPKSKFVIQQEKFTLLEI